MHLHDHSEEAISCLTSPTPHKTSAKMKHKRAGAAPKTVRRQTHPDDHPDPLDGPLMELPMRRPR
eukprot:4657133-Alexandrium_andersonii.AAC.1